MGIRRGGVLIARGGQLRHPPSWTGISAVCTEQAFRGQNLAARLVRAVAAGIRDRCEAPFPHANGANTNAIRLYDSLGFTLRPQGPRIHPPYAERPHDAPIRPSAKRPAPGRPDTRSAARPPMAGANLNPCPENPASTVTGPSRSMTKSWSGVVV